MNDFTSLTVYLVEVTSRHAYGAPVSCILYESGRLHNIPTKLDPRKPTYNPVSVCHPDFLKTKTGYDFLKRKTQLYGNVYEMCHDFRQPHHI